MGDGFSAIVSDGQTLYTLYRSGDDDVVIAMDGSTGKTRWETKYAAPFDETCSERLGPSPRSAPLITGDRLITVSAGGMMHSFDRASGQKQWNLPLDSGCERCRETMRILVESGGIRQLDHHDLLAARVAASLPWTRRRDGKSGRPRTS